MTVDSRRRHPLLAAVALTTAAIVGSPALAAGTAPAIAYDRATRTATVSLTAGQDDGYNFNGYASGALIVRVPTGTTVQITMRNLAADVSHSVLVAPWDERTKGGGLTAAFPGAAPPHPDTGITAHDPPLGFRFTASAAGQYALVCGVPGHALIGMWDELDVVDGLPAPSVVTR